MCCLWTFFGPFPFLLGGGPGITGRPTFYMYGTFVYVATHKRVGGFDYTTSSVFYGAKIFAKCSITTGWPNEVGK